MMFEKILLLSASDEVAPALARRARSLLGTSSSIEVFEPVYESMLEGYLGNTEIYEPLRRRSVEDRLERAREQARDLRENGAKGVSAKAIWDHPRHQAVAREVLESGADLVVMSVRDRLSHDDWQLVSTCPAAVLVVKSEAESGYQNIVAAVDPTHAHAKPAELDGAILRHAMAVQAATKAHLKIVHCFAPLAEFVSTQQFPRLPIDEVEKRLENARRHAIDDVISEAQLAADDVELVAGRPGDVLEAMAAEGRADLLVMGGLARGRIKDLLIGNTAERVLGHVAVDVLIVKPPGLEIGVAVKAK